MPTFLKSQSFILLLFAVAVLVGFQFLRPAYADWKNIKMNVKSLEHEISESEVRRDKLAALSKELSGNKGNREALLRSVPKEFQEDIAILDLKKITSENGFFMNSLSFSEGGVFSEYSSVQSLDIYINLNGSYSDLIPLLQSLENADRLFTVSSLNIQKSGEDSVSLTMQIMAYYQ